MSGGSFNVDRGVWNHPVFRKSKFSDREAFMWLVSEASWRERTIRSGVLIIDLRRGELSHSLRFMADKWGWTHSSVKRYLETLENRNMICNTNETGQNVITICNYEKYQNKPKTSETATATPYATAPQQDRNKEEYLLIPDVIPEKEDTSHLEAFCIYNKAAEESGWPECQAFNKTRVSKLKARLKSVGGIEGWASAIRKAQDSDFLCNRAAKSFTANIDFILQDASFTRLIEGNYDNRTNGGHNGNGTNNHTSNRAIEEAERTRRIVTAAARGTSDQDWAT